MVSLPEVDLRPPVRRRIFANRTLNLRAIRAIGFDMDYTLVHYRTEVWERRAYEHSQALLAQQGWPVSDLVFDPTLVMPGLVLDLELGNVVKANRFGYIKKACHGTRPLPFEEQRRAYARTLVDLAEPRWVFLNTLFALSEGCMLMQAVDLLDVGRLPGVLGYADLYEHVRASIDATHMEGALKAQVAASPGDFVTPDDELPLALLDIKHAGKKLLLITNSEWTYTRDMMSWVLDGRLPGAMTWRDVFDVVIVSAAKPGFFDQQRPLFEVVDDSGLLRPAHGLREGCAFLGGTAAAVEEHLGMRGEEILYFGDHIYADVHMSKSALRWRTGLVVRELEEEVAALETFAPRQAELSQLMDRKEELEHEQARARLDLQRSEGGYCEAPGRRIGELRELLRKLRADLDALDTRIAPLAKEATELGNPRWGLLMRTGNDKSHLARQIERYADIYTSRVSNLLTATPFSYLRSPRGNLPHDPACP